MSSKHSQQASYSHDLSRYLHRTQNYTTCSHVSAAVSSCFADFLENGTMSVRTDLHVATFDGSIDLHCNIRCLSVACAKYIYDC